MPYIRPLSRRTKPLPKHPVTTISTATALLGTSSTWSMSCRLKDRSRNRNDSMPQPNRSALQPLLSFGTASSHNLFYPSPPVASRLFRVINTFEINAHLCPEKEHLYIYGIILYAVSEGSGALARQLLPCPTSLLNRYACVQPQPSAHWAGRLAWAPGDLPRL